MRDLDVVVVGAGFAGLYMVHRARESGWSVQGFEAGSGVGGTWYWNRYPGARCDIESMEYSYSFCDDLQQEWEWSERYAGQPEILRYLEHVAERFDLRRSFQFNERVLSAVFDDATSRWIARTDAGAEVSSQFLVMATGCLSSTNLPDIAGLDEFEGEVFHTGQWPHEGVEFDGKRVGVIGTGSSGVQSIPIIAEEARHLTVFQRTPTYSVPAHNRPLSPDEQRVIKADYAAFRAANRTMPAAFGSRLPEPKPSALEAEHEERVEAFEARWGTGGLAWLATFADVPINRDANTFAAEFVRAKIRDLVDDPETAERLIPSQVIGCKRLCLDTGYYETFNRDDVRLVDISATPIERITPTGLRAGDENFELDCIVFATGFDAMTGSLARIDIRGREGVALRDEWEAGPRTYLGLGIPRFPNLFIVSGPGSPSVLTNMVVSIEQHVEWITDCIDHVRSNGVATIEATVEAADHWVGYVNMVADLTLFPTCNSWYLGANVPGKPRVFMPLPGFPPYAEYCKTVAEKGYEGFVLTPS